MNDKALHLCLTLAALAVGCSDPGRTPVEGDTLTDGDPASTDTAPTGDHSETPGSDTDGDEPGGTDDDPDDPIEVCSGLSFDNPLDEALCPYVQRVAIDAQ